MGGGGEGGEGGGGGILLAGYSAAGSVAVADFLLSSTSLKLTACLLTLVDNANDSCLALERTDGLFRLYTDVMYKAVCLLM